MINERRTDHTCHAIDCAARCKPEYLMCWTHWRRVPKSMQADVYRFYRPGQCDFDPLPSKNWHRAASKAIKAVADKEGKSCPANIVREAEEEFDT